MHSLRCSDNLSSPPDLYLMNQLKRKIQKETVILDGFDEQTCMSDFPDFTSILWGQRQKFVELLHNRELKIHKYKPHFICCGLDTVNM